MSLDALVIGAGPAGLAASYELTRAGADHVVLERGAEVADTWANLYDSLVLHTARGLSSLPGMTFPNTTPQFPSRADLVSYLHSYAAAFKLPIRTRADVVSLQRAGPEWIATTVSGEQFRARSAVVATGIVANPVVPAFPGRDRFRGRVFHSVEYRRPDGFAGREVLVVGAGNSAGEIAAELAHAGARVTISIRSGATVLPREVAAVPIQYFALAIGALPRIAQRALMVATARVSSVFGGRPVLPAPHASTCPNVPLIGFSLVNAVREGRIRVEGALEEFMTDGVRLAGNAVRPFDDVILATGFQAAIGMLASGGAAVRLDDCGFARRRDRVVSLDQPDLYFIGHTYDLRGTLFNISRDARTVAREIRARHV